MDPRISDYLRGRTVSGVFYDGLDLLIETTDGHRIVLGFDVNTRRHILKRVDVVIQLPNLKLAGAVGHL